LVWFLTRPTPGRISSGLLRIRTAQCDATHIMHYIGFQFFEATQTIDASKFKDKLEKAIEYFDKSSKEVIYSKYDPI